MDNGNKNPPKILSTYEIRKLAGNWSLAGDVGLLGHLEQLSESIFRRTEETQKDFDELIDEYEETYVKVGNVTNQFLALQNCQFVENRVYDEETPTEEKPEVKVQDEAEQERLLLLQYKEAVEVGVKLLDTHFQEVQLPPNSDSDEEDEISEGNSIIWKPKNPYAGKKFPLLIGSAEWWADDHVGLRTNEENLETEKNLSESESDFESLKSAEKKLKSTSSSASSMENLKPVTSKPFLESSSEDIFGLDKNDKINNADDFFSKNSLLDEPVSFLPDIENVENLPEVVPKPKDIPSEIEQAEEEVKKPKKTDNAFTRELMAKLSNVTTKNGNETKEKEQEAPPTKPAEENLFDETDDSSDLFSTTVIPDSNPVGEKGLFFDVENDDQLFSGSNDLFSGSSLFENEKVKPETQPAPKKTIEPIVKEKKKVEESKKEVIAPKKNFVEDLFEDLDDDETLFATKPTEKSVFPSTGLETKKQAPVAPEMNWDNNEGLFDSINNVIDDDFLISPSFIDKTPKSKPETKTTNEAKVKEPDDIFESETNGNDPFGFAPTEKVAEPEDDDLFSAGFKSSSKVDDDSSLFSDKPKQPDSTSISSSRSSLFDDANASKTRLASVFEKENKTEDLFTASENSVKSTKKSLFDDDGDDGDDLFGEKSLFENKNESGGLFPASPKIKETKAQIPEQKLFQDVDDGELFAAKEKKPTPPSSLTLPGKSVGKLSIPDNLKSRFESAAKRISPGGVKAPLKEETPPKEEEETISKEVTPTKEDTFEPSNLLKCPSKDRVKIPGRRRPQSRKARQEAIRNSGIWDQPQSPPVSSPNPLSPSTDEEDFFKVPELDTNFEKEDQSIFKSDLFESKPEDGLLFDGAPVLSPKKPETNTVSLFDDDDENLFSATPKQTKITEVKKPLFEANLDEDDDLFGGKVHATPSKAPPTNKPKDNETKDKGNTSFVDPLGLMSNDD